jgi:hypothetical protein
MLTVMCLLPPLPSRPQVKAMLAGVMAAAVTVISANIHCVYVCACLSTANSSVADAGVSAALPPSCSLLQVMAMLAGAMAAAVCVISANQCIHEGLSALLTKQERVEGGGAVERWLQHVGKQRQHCSCREVSEAGKGCYACLAMRR